jgi:4'-phosphopantetheinyl transferase EntD
MIARLLPRAVRSADSLMDLPGDLYPEEECWVVNAVPHRRGEFTTVRVCARQAIIALGVPPGPIAPGRRGAPQWPSGVVGSMTHCAGYRAAAVALTSDIRSLGIDAEPHAALPEGILDVIALPSEQKRVKNAGDRHWDRLLFSAKESVFKAWFPMTDRELGFEEADIDIHGGNDDEEGTFTAHLLRSAPSVPRHFAGRWLISGGIVMTAVVIRHPAEELTRRAQRTDR